MKDWKIILWLVLFFPVGIYLMYKYSHWPRKIKNSISIFFIIITFITAGLIGDLMYLIGFTALLAGIYTFIKNKDKKRSLLLVAIGMLLFVTTATANYQIEQAQERERVAIELQEQEKAERLVKEEQEKKLAAQKRIEEEQKQKAKEETKQLALKAVEKVEKEPIKENYDLAFQTLNKLDEKEPDLASRLDKVKPIMEKYEEEKLLIIAAIEKAEGDKIRSSYDEAYSLVTASTFSENSFISRLSELDDEITVIENEKIAAEKMEVEKIAADLIRIEAESEAIKVVAEEEAIVDTIQEQQITNVVYIAPDSGTKYHYYSTCRGLSNANSIVEIDLSAAQSQGYELCGWED